METAGIWQIIFPKMEMAKQFHAVGREASHFVWNPLRCNAAYSLAASLHSKQVLNFATKLEVISLYTSG